MRLEEEFPPNTACSKTYIKSDRSTRLNPTLLYDLFEAFKHNLLTVFERECLLYKSVQIVFWKKLFVAGIKLKRLKSIQSFNCDT